VAPENNTAIMIYVSEESEFDNLLVGVFGIDGCKLQSGSIY